MAGTLACRTDTDNKCKYGDTALMELSSYSMRFHSGASLLMDKTNGVCKSWVKMCHDASLLRSVQPKHEELCDLQPTLSGKV